MKKKRFKLLAGMLALSTNLIFTGCGAEKPEEETIIEENIENESEAITSSISESSTAISAAVSEALSTTIENLDEFSEERAIFGNLITNSEIIYTDEFKSVDYIYIDWNTASNHYEMTATHGDTKFELTLENSELINFIIHQTNCRELMIDHDKNNTLLSSLTACDTIKSISLNDCNISSLDGLSSLTNLEELTISNCKNITDLSPIAELSNLKKIAINGTKIADISVLANLPELTYLNLRCNEITNPEVLDVLENISVLDLEFNRISDIESLRGLISKGILSEEHASAIVESCEKHRLSFTTENYQEEARVLYITYLDSKESYFVELRNENQEMLLFALTDDTFDFYNLTKDTPNCTGIKITNIPGESHHFSVQDPQKYDAMVIDHCDIDSVSFVDDFENLTYLSIENCPNLVDSFDFGPFNINNMDKLKTLIVRGTSIKNFDSLRNFSSLEELEIRDNDVSEYGFLMNIPNLKVALIGIDNYPVDVRPFETIQENGVYVAVAGYNLPPLEENSEEESLDEEVEEPTEEPAKGYGLTPEN